MAEISKKITQVEIDTLNSKIIKIKEQIFAGDSIKIKLKVMEHGVSKILGNDTIARVTFTVDGENTFEQTDNVNIESSKGVVTFTPKQNYIREGANLIQCTIYDNDEEIILAPIMIVAYPASDKQIISENANEVQTIIQLKKIVDDFSDKVTKINQDIVMQKDIMEDVDIHLAKLTEKVSNTILDINKDVEFLKMNISDIADRGVADIRNALNVQMESIDKVYVKSIQLNKKIVNNFVQFESEILGVTPKDLLNCAMIVNICTSPYNTGIITQFTGILTFTLENNMIYGWLAPLSNRAVQGNKIETQFTFKSNYNNSLSLTDNNITLKFTTNGIPASLNNSNCILTPTSYIL